MYFRLPSILRSESVFIGVDLIFSICLGQFGPSINDIQRRYLGRFGWEVFNYELFSRRFGSVMAWVLTVFI